MVLNSNSLNQKMEDLKKLYTDYLETDEKTEDLTVNYVNDAFNCINAISKIVCLSTKIQLKKTEPIVEKVEESSSGATDEANNNEPATQPDEEVKEEESIEESNAESNDESEEVEKEMTEVEFVQDKMKKTAEYFKGLANQAAEIVEASGMTDTTIGELTDEEKQQRVDEFDDKLIKYIDTTPEELIHDELISWGAKESWAGFRILMNIKKAIDRSENTLNKDSDTEFIWLCLSEAFGKTPKQIMNNIDTLAKKCDFSNPLFFDVLKKVQESGKTVTGELIVREVLELFEDDDEE